MPIMLRTPSTLALLSVLGSSFLLSACTTPTRPSLARYEPAPPIAKARQASPAPVFQMSHSLTPPSPDAPLTTPASMRVSNSLDGGAAKTERPSATAPVEQALALTPLNKFVLQDVMAQLPQHFPPARTALVVESLADQDGLSQALINQLRIKGYAVKELPPPPPRSWLERLLNRQAPRPPINSLNGEAVYLLQYVLTEDPSLKLHRLDVRVGASVLSRAYVYDTSEKRWHAAGAWSAMIRSESP